MLDQVFCGANDFWTRAVVDIHVDFMSVGKVLLKVTGICGTMVKIVCCQGLGDDWEIPEYGDEAVILLSQALEIVGRRDKMADWMEKRRKGKRKSLYD